jgi:hypothetical protein
VVVNRGSRKASSLKSVRLMRLLPGLHKSALIVVREGLTFLLGGSADSGDLEAGATDLQPLERDLLRQTIGSAGQARARARRRPSESASHAEETSSAAPSSERGVWLRGAGRRPPARRGPMDSGAITRRAFGTPNARAGAPFEEASPCTTCPPRRSCSRLASAASLRSHARGSS